MYNEKVKQLFLDTLNADAYKRFTTVFKYVEALEASRDEDAYDMPYDVILTYLMQHGNYSNYSSIYDRYTSLKQYKTWALLNNYVAEDSKAYVDEKFDLKSIYLTNNKVTIFKHPKEFADYLGERLYARNLPDGNMANSVITIDDLTAALCMLVYNGLPVEEVLQLTIDQVYVTDTNVAVVTDKRVITIYNEFRDTILKVRKNRKYWRVSGRQSEIITLGDIFLDNGISDTTKRLRGSYIRVMYSRDVDVKFTDLYYIGKLYDFFSHNVGSDYRRKDIVEYCFQNESITHRRREQFYRILELWQYQ